MAKTKEYGGVPYNYYRMKQSMHQEIDLHLAKKTHGEADNYLFFSGLITRFAVSYKTINTYLQTKGMEIDKFCHVKKIDGWVEPAIWEIRNVSDQEIKQIWNEDHQKVTKKTAEEEALDILYAIPTKKHSNEDEEDTNEKKKKEGTSRGEGNTNHDTQEPDKP